MKKILVAFGLLAVLVPIGAAQAAVVQQFNFQLRDIKPDGRFTVVFTSRTYDDQGGIPPVLRENYLRLPAGARIPRDFLRRQYYCDGNRLLDTLRQNPDESVQFARRVENLRSTARKLRSRGVSRRQLRNLETCRKVEVGRGTVQVDARPFLNELIPAKIYLFFGKATVRGAVAAFWILGVPDENAPIVRNTPVVRQTRVAIASNFFNDPTPDGKYGYRLQLPAGPIAGVNISVAEVNVTTKGLTITKKRRTCVRRRGGRCVRRRTRTTRVFWFTQPTCPPSGRLGFAAFYGYDDPTPDITRTIELSCPDFDR